MLHKMRFERCFVVCLLISTNIGVASGHFAQPPSTEALPENSEQFPGPDSAAGKLPEPLSPEVTEFVRGLILLSIPENFSDTSKWGTEARIQSGLNMDLEGLRLKTSRRWKDVNHGSWRRADEQLKNPADTFQIKLMLLPHDEPELRRYHLQAVATIRATGRQQQWNYGVMLWSISAEAEFDIALDVELDVRQQISVKDGRPQWSLTPTVETAAAKVTRFSLRRISHSKGSAIREFGSWFEGLINDRVSRMNNKLPDKINRKLAQKQDRLVVPLWFSPSPSGAVPTPAEH